MESIWIGNNRLQNICKRNEDFWEGKLKNGPLLWVTVPEARPGKILQEPAKEEQMWTNVDYYVAKAEEQLSLTHYAGDALPVCHPWLGPDQVAAWLGADITLKPKEYTSWIKPFINDWSKYQQLKIESDNKWWKLYLSLVERCAKAGVGKWVTAYPDLHTGLDGLCAIRGAENLMMDLVTNPEVIQNAMEQMTDIWRYVVDTVSDIILPAGQGTSNWTMGWSDKRFLCIGQNDFSCMISPEMFESFCWRDNVECCDYVDYTIYHLDGPDALKHLPKVLEIKNLNCIQWIQGAGNPPPSNWIDLLRQIQDAGKSVQLLYGQEHTALNNEINILCNSLDKNRLFIRAVTDSIEKSDALVGN